MTLEAKLLVIRAEDDGRTVEQQFVDGDQVESQWSPKISGIWDFDRFNYRIKPEPIEIWVLGPPAFRLDGLRACKMAYRTRDECIRAADPGSSLVPMLFRQVTTE